MDTNDTPCYLHDLEDNDDAASPGHHCLGCRVEAAGFTNLSDYKRDQRLGNMEDAADWKADR